jgi:hypothetical protein
MKWCALALSAAAVVGLSGCSAQPNVVLMERNAVHVIGGLYEYSLDTCAGGNTFHPDHPGVVFYDLIGPSGLKIGHCVFEPNLRSPRGIPSAFADWGPVVVHIVPDPNQPPRNLV